MGYLHVLNGNTTRRRLRAGLPDHLFDLLAREAGAVKAATMSDVAM